MKTFRFTILLFTSLFFACGIPSFSGVLQAQHPRLVKDYSFVMEIPGVRAMESSATHLYVLSRVEGLAVFRSRPDTLQWLYTTPGMIQRGEKLEADVRFAYLDGERNRFSVIEPTSVVGVYSATSLPAQPVGSHRIGTDLYIGMGSKGIGRLSLRSPSAFDSTVTYVLENKLSSPKVLDVDGRRGLLAISTARPSLTLVQADGRQLTVQKRITPEKPLHYIYYSRDNQIYAATSSGQIYKFSGRGQQKKIGNIGEPIHKIRPWKQWLIIRGASGRLWTSYKAGKPRLWKDNPRSGNYFTISKGQFWINEYNKITRIRQIDSDAGTQPDTLGLFTNIRELNLQPIDTYVSPLPHPVLIPVQLEESYPVEALQYTYESPTIEDAFLRKQGFYWQPGSDDVGSHRVTIIASASSGATDSVQFSINIKSFNSPPRFAPIRTVTVPAGTSYTMTFQAFDPDGRWPDLIRYLGMNLPENSSINQQTGKFTWTPTANQTGKHTFKVIATDQYGAAASREVTLRVIPQPDREPQESSKK